MCRNILLASVGMSPAVVTETLWALLNPADGSEPFVADVVHIVTTDWGKKRIIDSGLQERIRELFSQHGRPEPRIIVEVPRDEAGQPIADINTEEENIAFADHITEVFRRYSQNRDSRIHLSLAGGRKTMTSFTHAAAMFFGREQDALSHVLVEPPVLEQCADFWWPGQPEQTVLTRDGAPVSTKVGDARVILVETPFVRLRYMLDEQVLEKRLSYRDVVAQLQAAVHLQMVRLEFATRTVHVGEDEIKLPHREFALYAVLAKAAKFRWPGAGPKGIGPRHRGWLTYDMLLDDTPAQREFLEFYKEVHKYKHADDEEEARTGTLEDTLRQAFHDAAALERAKDSLQQAKARLNDEFKRLDPVLFNRVAVHYRTGRGRRSRFGLLLEPHFIELDFNG